MPKYVVTVTRLVTEDIVMEVEAADGDAARLTAELESKHAPLREWEAYDAQYSTGRAYAVTAMDVIATTEGDSDGLNTDRSGAAPLA
jgi:hypothetical protein